VEYAANREYPSGLWAECEVCSSNVALSDDIARKHFNCEKGFNCVRAAPPFRARRHTPYAD
jgi:hypothetical protein